MCGEDRVIKERWLEVGLAIAYLVFLHYDNPALLAVCIYLFVAGRLLSTRPLLDIMQSDRGAENTSGAHAVLKRCFIRSLWAVPAIVYIGGFAYLLLLQAPIYWLCGRFRRKDSLLPECATGFIFGICI